METHMGLFEVKTHLSSLIDDVEHGKEIVITRRGKPVAKLTPIDAIAHKSRDLKEVFDAMRKIRAGVRKRQKRLGLPPLTRKEIKDMIEKGRR